MAGGSGLRIAITGANGNLGRKLVAAFLSDPDVAILRALDLEFGNVPPQNCSRIEPVLVDLRKDRLEEALGLLVMSFILRPKIPSQTLLGRTQARPST
jgi:nucleoside-diphosphate-sugar epimerase